MAEHPALGKLPTEIDGIKVQSILREFFQNSDYGEPNNISKAGCLALFKKSAEVGQKGKAHVLWNAWREAFPVGDTNKKRKNKVDFSNTNFEDLKLDQFDSFIFGDYANFQKTTFGIGSRFKGTEFGIESDFSHAIWGSHSNFEDTHWGKNSLFKAAKWDRNCIFYNATWGNNTQFQGACWQSNAEFLVAKFGEYSNFRGARWNHKANFTDSHFGDATEFQGAQFGFKTNFDKTKWGIGTNFQARSWDQLRQDFETNEQWEQSQQEAHDWGCSPDAFLDINFSGACFAGTVDFSNRQFKAETRFAFCDFQSAPLFHDCEFHQNTSFEGAKFPNSIGSEDAARSYRTLKLSFNKQQAVRDEQRFFSLEMAEEAKGHNNRSMEYLKNKNLFKALSEYLSWLAYQSYKYFSNYGFSVARPLLVWTLCLLGFAYIYGSYSCLQPCLSINSNCEWQSDWLNFSIKHALPLPGFDKVEETIKGVPIFLLALHKTVSIATLFLMGLALRNLFKLK